MKKFRRLPQLKKGAVFNELTVVGPVGKDWNGSVLYLCECSCGGSTVERTWEIMNGKTTSCGCRRKHNAKLLSTKNSSIKKSGVDRNGDTKNRKRVGNTSIPIREQGNEFLASVCTQKIKEAYAESRRCEGY